MRYSTLIDPETLVAELENDDFCVVDCRATLGDPEAGPRAFEAGHIPGAVHAHLENVLSGPVVPGVTGRHPLPDPDALATQLAAWGIDYRSQIVAYDDGPGAFAARLWWLARSVGHADVAVLDGGYRAWTAAGHPTERTTRPRRRRRFQRRAPLTRVVGADALLGERHTMLDARAEARYLGLTEPIDKVAGHIPGATSVPYEGNLDQSGRFLSAAALRRRFAPYATTHGRPLVCYCGSGVTACHNVLAARIAGYDEPALYPGSWSEWITDSSRPIER